MAAAAVATLLGLWAMCKTAEGGDLISDLDHLRHGVWVKAMAVSDESKPLREQFHATRSLCSPEASLSCWERSKWPCAGPVLLVGIPRPQDICTACV